MRCRALLQGIFPTQESNTDLPHCMWILHCLSHQKSPRILEWVAYHFSRGSSLSRDRTGVSCITGGFFCQLSYQGSPYTCISPVQFSCSVVSDTLQPHGLQHASLHCPSPTPRVQTHVHQVSDAVQPSHPLSPPSPAFSLSQHQGLFH